MVWMILTLIAIAGGLILHIMAGIHQSGKQLETASKELIKATRTQDQTNSSNPPLGKPPEPVGRYLAKTLGQNQSPMNHVRLKQVGMLKTNPSSQKWLPFTANQLVTQNPAAFIWDAKVKLAPGVHLQIRDSYTCGIGSGQVSLMSTFCLGHEENKPELNDGALFRYLAEAAWHPSTLLPHTGIEWTPINAFRATAHLTDRGNNISLDFRFNELGEIISVFTEDRFGYFGDKYEKYPWEGFFSNYKEFNGIRIPTKGEVGWHLPDGFWLFWKGEIVSAEFYR